MMNRLITKYLSLILTHIVVGFVATNAATNPPTQTQRAWPFTERTTPSPPPLQANETALNGIDHFVLEKLNAANITLAPETDRGKLARRLYFDLIGLPPTPAELDSYIDNTDPKAYETLVNTLLDDPRHGERWARLWLDLARYADTAGYEGDPDLPYAWRYRDYVIESLNQDKPYDVFIKEQIAGDEFQEIMGAGDLPQTPAEKAVALTFLRLAPFTEPRGDETRHEMLSEMTSTVSSVFLGLTVGCAQCHDHKYDPIPTKDFYRMKAFFSTVWLKRPEQGDIFQIGAPLPAQHYRKGEPERIKAMKAERQEALTASKDEFEKLKSQFKDRLGLPNAGFGIQSSGSTIGNHYLFETSPVADEKLHHSILNSANGEWQFFTDNEGPSETKPLSGQNTGHWFASIDSPTYIGLGQQTNPDAAATGNAHEGRIAEVLVYDHPLDKAERQLISACSDAKYRLGSSSILEPPSDGLTFWLDASDPDADPKTPIPDSNQPLSAWIDKINGIALTQSESKRQPRIHRPNTLNAPTVRFDDSLLIAKTKSAPFYRHTSGAIVMIYGVEHRDEGYGFSVGGKEDYLTTVIYPNKADNANLNSILEDKNNPIFTKEERRQYDYLSNRERFTKQHLKRLEPMAMSLRHSYGPPFEPGVPVSRVMLRGEHDNPGEVVVAGFPSAITGHDQPAPIRLDPFKRWPTRSRRMTLADWIASPENPLTARVIVNRLWHWHFGRGIVRTPSDFGKLSGGPSHPALLDWLANKFIEEKWSLKAIHRLIVNSKTYRQAAHVQSAEATQIDPDNTLLWHFNPRRLEAEAIRDSVLSVSGRLNPEIFGPPIFPELPGGIEEQVKYNNSKWDTDHTAVSRKRSIYVYQQRTLSMPFLQTFDSLVCEDTRPMRRTSTTPLQALAMFNGKLINQEADHFAERISAHSTNPTERVKWAFLAGLGRHPSPDEVEDMLPFATDQNLNRLARIIFNTNEFVYVD